MESVSLKIDGMSCGSCVNSVKKALTAVPGIASVGVNLADGTARIDGTGLSLAAIEAAIADAGYGAKVLEPAAPSTDSGTPPRSGGCGIGKTRGGCCCG